MAESESATITAEALQEKIAEFRKNIWESRDLAKDIDRFLLKLQEELGDGVEINGIVKVIEVILEAPDAYLRQKLDALRRAIRFRGKTDPEELIQEVTVA